VVFCSQCGSSSRDMEGFCRGCGAPMASAEPVAPVPAPDETLPQPATPKSAAVSSGFASDRLLPKNVWVAALLTLVLGPPGMIYSTPAWSFGHVSCVHPSLVLRRPSAGNGCLVRKHLLGCDGGAALGARSNAVPVGDSHSVPAHPSQLRYALRLIDSNSAPSIRLCQPRSEALKWSITSGDSRSDANFFAGVFADPAFPGEPPCPCELGQPGQADRARLRRHSDHRGRPRPRRESYRCL
jgi:hypothetical protein